MQVFIGNAKHYVCEMVINVVVHISRKDITKILSISRIVKKNNNIKFTFVKKFLDYAFLFNFFERNLIII